jgi:hypothetical protein
MIITRLHHALGEASIGCESRLGAALDVKLAVGSCGLEPLHRAVVKLQQTDSTAGRGDSEQGLGHFEGEGEGRYLRLRYCD